MIYKKITELILMTGIFLYGAGVTVTALKINKDNIYYDYYRMYRLGVGLFFMGCVLSYFILK